MPDQPYGRVAIVYPGDEEARRNATPDNNRFAPLFSAFAAAGVAAEPAVYHDDVCALVRRQLLLVDAVLVWVNPIEDRRDRTLLDAILREVADAGVFVSSHPDLILQLGTKEVLYTTRSLGWGSDTLVYRTLEQLAEELPLRLATGQARVLKQYRGHSGIGIWKVALLPGAALVPPQPDTLVRVRHAQRGAVEEEIALAAFVERCAPYFAGAGRMIDQAFQERLPEGMIRCYLVHDQVVGFGHQAINALFPAPLGADTGTAPQPGPRLYHPPTMPEFQTLKQQLEQEWLPTPTRRRPILWRQPRPRSRRCSSGAQRDEPIWVYGTSHVGSISFSLEPLAHNLAAPRRQSRGTGFCAGAGRCYAHQGNATTARAAALGSLMTNAA